MFVSVNINCYFAQRARCYCMNPRPEHTYKNPRGGGDDPLLAPFKC